MNSIITVAIVLGTVMAMPSTLLTQELKVARSGPTAGMVHDGDGEWRPPTPADALRALADASVPRRQAAEAVLRQVYGPWPEADLAALADALADAIIDGRSRPGFSGRAFDMRRALESAAMTPVGRKFRRGWRRPLSNRPEGPEELERDPGTPYPGAWDALIRVYEHLEERWRSAGGTAAFPGPTLSAVFLSDPMGRGGGYVRGLFDAAKPPPPGLTVIGKQSPETNSYLWCQAGQYLYGDIFRNRWSPDALAELGTPPLLTDSEAEKYTKLCGKGGSMAVR